MTNLNDHQEKLLRVVKETFDDVMPVLDKMKAEYEYAEYRAKKPLQEAVEQAIAGGVPMSRITKEGTNFTYPQKLTNWLATPQSVTDRLEGGDVALQATDTLEDGVSDIETVTRDPRTGAFKVWQGTRPYEVKAFGPDDAAWAEREENIPQVVYDLISDKYPDFVLLEPEDENE